MRTLYLPIALGWCGLLLSIFNPLLNPNFQHFNSDYLLYFSFSFLLFYIGLTALNIPFKSPQLAVSTETFVNFLLILICLAVLFKLIDRFHMRPVGDLFNVLSYREARRQDSNIFSILGGVLSSFGVVAYSQLISTSTSVRKLRIFFIFILIVLIFLDIVLSGSRGILLVLTILIFSNHMRARHIVLVVPVLALISSVFFLYRFDTLVGGTSQQTGDLMMSLSSAGYSRFVPVGDNINFPNGFIGYIMFSIVQAAQYISHGIFEFAETFGMAYNDVFCVSGLLPSLDNIFQCRDLLISNNVYYTLAGTEYISFGYWSLLIMLISGIFMGFSFTRADKVSVGAKRLIALSILLVPYVNSIGGYDIWLYIFSILVLSFVKLSDHSRRSPA